MYFCYSTLNKIAIPVTIHLILKIPNRTLPLNPHPHPHPYFQPVTLFSKETDVPLIHCWQDEGVCHFTVSFLNKIDQTICCFQDNYYVPPPTGRGTYYFWCGSHWHDFLVCTNLVKQWLDFYQIHGHITGT